MKKALCILLVSLLIVLPLCSIAESTILSDYQTHLIGSWILTEGYYDDFRSFSPLLDNYLTISKDDIKNGKYMLFVSGNNEIYFNWGLDMGSHSSVAIVTFDEDYNFMMLYKPSSELCIVYKRQ